MCADFWGKNAARTKKKLFFEKKVVAQAKKTIFGKKFAERNKITNFECGVERIWWEVIGTLKKNVTFLIPVNKLQIFFFMAIILYVFF